ncbi:MAG: bile acid:sodium symporter [Rubripirellula sp.]|jgi:sodium/bile acid cotransporter 7|nr:bile acid:sodium symporter [Rubripirellula sp.]
MWEKLAKHWFLVALAISFAVGYFWAEAWSHLLEWQLLRGGIVFVVMWAMSITLRNDAIRKSYARPLPSLLSIGISVLLVPLLCLPTIYWLPESLFGGLFIAAIVPCTLASASVWTRRAGGDGSVAMMTTVVTNLACVVVAPIGIWLVLSTHAEIDVVGQVMKLSIIVVLPLLLAQSMRRMGAADWADRNRGRLSGLGQAGMLVMVAIGAATCGVTDTSSSIEVTPWLIAMLIFVSAAGLHTVTLFLGIFFSRCMGLDRGKQIAVAISGSQKTLMVGLQMAIDCGVSVVPMIVYHLYQLVFDTVVVDHWKEASDVGDISD